MSTRLTRRRFLQAGAAAATAPLILRADDRKQPASEKLNVAVVGVNGRGRNNLDGVAGAGANIAVLCDVDENRAAKPREDFPKALYFPDFRKALEHKGLDAVVISTPDHTHAVVAMTALKLGLHVYCEKPLTHTVHEARTLIETAAKTKRVTQMGTQIHAGNNYRRVVELIQTGAIGTVKEVHTWCGRSWGGGDRPKEMPPVPQGLHYDLWVGPAPYRPYHKDHLHFEWRRWWDFGGGTLADMACHHMDLAFWSLKLRHPTTIKAEGAPVHKETAADWLRVKYEFPARGDLPPVTLTWYDGGKRPELLQDLIKQGEVDKWGDGNLFVGDKGMLLADYNKLLLLPKKKFEGFEAPKPFIPASIGHHKEWVEACKSGGTTTCNFDYSGTLTEAVLLGNVSYRSGRELTLKDPARLKTGDDVADRLLHKEYRKGWSL